MRQAHRQRKPDSSPFAPLKACSELSRHTRRQPWSGVPVGSGWDWKRVSSLPRGCYCAGPAWLGPCSSSCWEL